MTIIHGHKGEVGAKQTLKRKLWAKKQAVKIRQNIG